MVKRKQQAKSGKRTGLMSLPQVTLIEICRRVKQRNFLNSNPIPLGELLLRIEKELKTNHEGLAKILGVTDTLIKNLIYNEQEEPYPYEALIERMDEVVDFMKALNLTVIEWELCPTGDPEIELHECISQAEDERLGQKYGYGKSDKDKAQEHFFTLLKGKLQEKNLSNDLQALKDLDPEVKKVIKRIAVSEYIKFMGDLLKIMKAGIIPQENHT